LKIRTILARCEDLYKTAARNYFYKLYAVLAQNQCGIEADTDLGGSYGFGALVEPLFRCRPWQVKQM